MAPAVTVVSVTVSCPGFTTYTLPFLTLPMKAVLGTVRMGAVFSKLKCADAYIPDLTSFAPVGFNLISIGKFKEASDFTEMNDTVPVKVLSGKTGIVIS